MTTEAQTQAPTNGAMPQVSHVKAQFQAMLAPTSKPVSRKAWGIEVSTIWLPYFTAAKTIGAVDDLDLPDEDLGAPFRLRRDRKTNEVRFSDTGRPMFTLAPNLNGMVKRATDNYVAGLITDTRSVMDEAPTAYAAQVERQHKAGAPVIAKEESDLAEATEALLASIASVEIPEPAAAFPKKGKKNS